MPPPMHRTMTRKYLFLDDRSFFINEKRVYTVNRERMDLSMGVKVFEAALSPWLHLEPQIGDF
ncbi:hypothetical protein WG66_014401 [Moniliophthora roreri]|nr:hypothetical protein WG66_014401 [Moniliophthora roreri]